MIRLAQPADALAIATVHVASWQAAYTGLVPQPYLDSLSIADFTTRWQTWLSPQQSNHTVLVAEIEDSVSGFVGGGPIRTPRPPFEAELYAIYLLPSVQRRGVGRQLFDRLIQAFSAQNYQSLLLWSLRHNPSTGFYERMGGQPIADETIGIGDTELPTRAFGWHTLPLSSHPQPHEVSA